MKYALLDDDIIFHQKFSTLFYKYNNNHDMLDCYYSIQDFLSCVNKYDILFLDIDLKRNITGISLAKQLYKDKPNLIIIYITNYDNLVYEANGLNIFRFIPKKFLDIKLPQLFIDINNEIEKNIFIELDNNIIRTADIVYVEKYDHDVYIHLINKIITIKQTTLQNIYDKLNKNLFSYINRAFIVNIQHIVNIHGNKLYLHNIKSHFVISISKLKEVTDKFKKYILN